LNNELHIIVNEKIYNNKKYFFCENKDIQSIVNYLVTKYNLFLISRTSQVPQPFKLNKVYKIFNLNFTKIFFLFLFFFIFFKKKKRVLIISITPFNFIIFIFYKFFFDCKFFLYLRSSGHEEYKNILGKKFVWIYDFMFKYITKHSEVISCHDRLYNKRCHFLYPSELTRKWNKKIKKNYFNKNIINILYVGRFKIEKGIYSLLNIFAKSPKNYRLILVGDGDLVKVENKRVQIINFVNKVDKLINIYDSTNIVILPSYTEAHPKVIDEALSRLRPVVVFDDIKHVINNRRGIFSIKRDPDKLVEIINYIRKNNKSISSDIKKNRLPYKHTFLKNLYKIVSQN
jgi:glycosyltransferase involved in cell wall biosynthesis